MEAHNRVAKGRSIRLKMGGSTVRTVAEIGQNSCEEGMVDEADMEEEA